MLKQSIVLHQIKCVKKILKRFKMDYSTAASSLVKPNLKLEKYGEEDKVDANFFEQIVGSLIYACKSRPDIGFSVGLVIIYTSEPMVSHMKVVRRILRYLK